MPAISARTAPAEITLISAALAAAAASDVMMAASIKARARLICVSPIPFCREDEASPSACHRLGASLRGRACRTSASQRIFACYTDDIARTATREDDTKGASLTKRAIGVAILGAGVAALAVTAQAGGDKVAFPADYGKGVVYMTLDRAENKQVREYFTSQAAVDAAKKGDPLPQGTVITVAQY